eukprot:m.207901 g.207901  ORF g.207901 m.207901 type:complete len:108 (-) comp25409_c0_seq5:173-496(-)
MEVTATALWVCAQVLSAWPRAVCGASSRLAAELSTESDPAQSGRGRSATVNAMTLSGITHITRKSRWHAWAKICPEIHRLTPTQITLFQFLGSRLYLDCGARDSWGY